MSSNESFRSDRFDANLDTLCHSRSARSRGRPLLRFLTRFAGFAYALTLTSCASIASDWESPLAIDSNVAGAKVEVFNHDGESIYQGQTPCEVVVDHERAFFLPEEYRVVVSNEGGDASETIVGTSLDEWYLGNALIPGGLVGSLLIDPWTGAMFELDTNEVFVELDAGRLPHSELRDRPIHISLSIDSTP